MILRKHIFSKNIARILFLIPGILLLCLFQKCTTKKEHKIITAFYYWKTNLQVNAEEESILKGTGASTIYLRLFDVDWNPNLQKALPVGILKADSIKDNSSQYIPVVYITQACLTRLQEKDVAELSTHIHALVRGLCTKYNLHPKEIQIDCDWTKNSAQVYFSLLKQLKSEAYFSTKLLSCTIRLHQVKFTTTSGIPPVDRGMLMVYNMGNLTRYGGHNSILEVLEAKDYLRHLGIYPLPLDVALPVYHWAALFEHSRFKGITYNISKSDFTGSNIEQKDDNLYLIVQDIVVSGYRFKKGQEIRFEEPDKKDLEEIGTYIGKHIKDSPYRVTFFHLDSRATKQFKAKDLNDIASTFR
ncbi:MAG: hypothetical protein WC756_06390 [Taibaiella sp.]|jgi:hypothetical protein